MRKSSKKFLSLGLAVTMAVGMTACGTKEKDKDAGNNDLQNVADNNTTAPTKAPGNTGGDTGNTGTEVVKPESIKVMVDGTVFTSANGRDEFEKALEAELGLDIIFSQPDHSGYYDVVQNTFAGGDWPDVILLGAAYYATYAGAGALADISSYWESSELKSSGRVTNPELIDSMYIDGKLYGFSPARGNGCVSYVRKAWLDKAGLSVPTNYEEYLNMLKVFTESDMDDSGDPTNTYGVSAAGLIGREAPYTNYLPEFYQDAYPDFYQKEDGTWVDGFGEKAMSDALQRLRDAYAAGYIDRETLTNGTKDCRDKYYSNKFGVFTYWAGTWASTITNNLAANNLDSELVVLPPIAEIGKYIERQAPVWCITSKCTNPEGVFKYFIEKMLDGGAVQTLWTYGVKGVHWDNIAETVTLDDGSDPSKSTAYEEGQFHFLPTLEKPDTLTTKGHIDAMLSIGSFIEGQDPGAGQAVSVALDCANKFNEWSVIAPVIVSNETINAESGNLWDIRTEIVTAVVTGTMTVEEGMAKYQQNAGTIVSDILASLQ